MKTDTFLELKKLWKKSTHHQMSKLNRSPDGKFATLYTGEGYTGFDLEVYTDDCDAKLALNSAEFLRALWNAWPEILESLTYLGDRIDENE